MENEKKSNGTLVGILIGIIIMLLVFIGLFATGTISFKTTTTNNNEQTSENNHENTKDTSSNTIEKGTTKNVDDEQLGNNCKYLQVDIEKYVLNYFIKINGSKADNGEDYQVESSLENNKFNIRIKHLQVDHITTDGYYEVDCNTGVGTSASDIENTINFLEYK